MIVIKAKSGNIFGGFTEEGFDVSVVDLITFIFSLVNKENNPFKVICSINSINGPFNKELYVNIICKKN